MSAALDNLDADKSRELAGIILSQLGGMRFKAMTGAKNLMATKAGLRVSLPRNFAKNGINIVCIELTPYDDYTVKFYRYDSRDLSCTCIKERESVYCDQLQDVFTEETGLYTSF